MKPMSTTIIELRLNDLLFLLATVTDTTSKKEVNNANIGNCAALKNNQSGH